MNQQPKIIFIAPIPPPITGQSIISEALLNELKDQYEFIVINYTRKDVKHSSKLNFKQIKNVIKLSKIIKQNSKSVDAIYLTVSQSLFGNLKDLYFLFKAGKKLKKKTIIHLHGGGFDEYFNKTFFFVKFFNKLILGKACAGIVLSKSLKKCLLPILPKEKIKIVHNFFDNDLLINEKNLNEKWKKPDIFNILFLSNLMEEKGYNELLDGYILLTDEYKKKCNLIFAGEFESKEKKDLFLGKIKSYKNIKYLGVIQEYQKKTILHQTHAFFLPTYYPIEGQPVSIIESYASGVTVFTTKHGGIPDIFKDKTNGEYVEKKSPNSIKEAIIKLINESQRYKKYAVYNRKYAEQFTKDIFIDNMSRIFKQVITQ